MFGRRFHSIRQPRYARKRECPDLQRCRTGNQIRRLLGRDTRKRRKGRCFGSCLRLYDLSLADGRACGCGRHADRRRCRQNYRQTTFRSRRFCGCRQRNRLWGDRRKLLERRRSFESSSLGRIPLGPRRSYFRRNRNRRKNADGRLLRTVQEFRRFGGGR